MWKQNVIYNNSYKTKKPNKLPKRWFFFFLQSMVFLSYGNFILAKLLYLMETYTNK